MPSSKLCTIRHVLFFRSAFGAGHVPRLSEMCVVKLQENVESITDTHGLEFDVLEPILERAKPETLMVIEDYNSYLTEYTGQRNLLPPCQSLLIEWEKSERNLPLQRKMVWAIYCLITKGF